MTTATSTTFIASRKALLAAYNAASSVSPVRSPKPILQSVKLVVTSDSAQVLGTDLEVGIRVEVPGIASDDQFELVLPRKFGEILSKSTDNEIKIKVGDDQQILVTGLRSKFKLTTEPAEYFPDVPEAPADTPSFVLQVGDLRTLITRTHYATDPESTRYALGGVLVEIDGENTIAFIGTDGRRLAKQTARVECKADDTGNQPVLPPSCVIPVKALKLILRAISDLKPDELVDIFLDKTRIIVRTSTATIYSRLVEGRFPRYQDVFPRSIGTKATATVGDLKLACQQATITTSDETRGVDFAFDTDCLTLTSQSADAGASTIEATIGLDGPPVVIAFDPRYLLDALATLDAGQEVVFELIDGKNAAVMRVDGGFAYVVMPLTRDR